MFHTPSDVEEVRLCSFLGPFLASFSTEAGFSSDMDKPAMAESTLVKGTDMIGLEVSCSNGRRWEEEKR
jgi:hypothetical protein